MKHALYSLAGIITLLSVWLASASAEPLWESSFIGCREVRQVKELLNIARADDGTGEFGEAVRWKVRTEDCVRIPIGSAVVLKGVKDYTTTDGTSVRIYPIVAPMFITPWISVMVTLYVPDRFPLLLRYPARK